MISFFVFLLIGSSHGKSTEKLDTFKWQEAYINAYKSASPSNAVPEALLTSKNTKEESRAQAPSLVEISSVLSDSRPSPYGPKYLREAITPQYPERSNSVQFFNMASCMLSPTDMIENHRDAQSCAKNEYSCMSFWSQEVSLQMLTRTWCITNAFETLPTSAQATVIAPYRKYLHNVVAPTWNYVMLMTSPQYGKSLDLASGLPSSAIQVQKSKNECENADTLPVQVQCMMRKLKDVAHVRSKFEEIPPSTFKAMQGAYHSQKEGLSLLKNEGLSVLRNSIEDQIPLGLVEVDSTVTPPPQQVIMGIPKSTIEGLENNGFANPVITSMMKGGIPRVGIPKPLISSINSHGGRASKNRFSSITPGLKMTLAEPTTFLIPESRGNDGSPGALYLSEGRNNSFHLYLPGGYFCYDAEMCFDRCKGAPMLCSSKGWEKDSVFSGAFNPNNGGMEGWTHGLLGYTSSDAYLGQTRVPEFVMVGGTKIEEDAGTLGSFFEGNTMASAALKKYVMMGLGQSPRTTLAVSGCSAGAIGLASMTDTIPRLLREHAHALNVPHFRPNILVIQDSAPITNGPPPSNGEMSLPDQSQALLYMLYTMQGQDSGLKTTYPRCFDRFGHLCLWSPYILPYLKTKNMVMHNMWDSFELGGGVNSSAYVWGLKLILEQGEVMERCTPRQNMFGPNCYDHCYTENPWWWRLAPATAKDPYWSWTAKDTAHEALKGNTGHKVRDQLVQFGSGCIGQSYFNSLMGVKQLKTNRR